MRVVTFGRSGTSLTTTVPDYSRQSNVTHLTQEKKAGLSSLRDKVDQMERTMETTQSVVQRILEMIQNQQQNTSGAAGRSMRRSKRKQNANGVAVMSKKTRRF